MEGGAEATGGLGGSQSQKGKAGSLKRLSFRTIL